MNFATEIKGQALTRAITFPDDSRNGLLKIAAGGLLSGIPSPLMVLLTDGIAGASGDFRIAPVALSFAVLVFILVRRCSANPW